MSELLRCPVCKATVAAEQGSACRRCRADLSLLIGLRRERAAALGAARQSLAARAFAAADAFLDRAEAIQPDAETQKIRAVLALCRCDFVGALGWYRRARG